MTKKTIRIDEEKCTGCGLCIPNCQKGAIQIINGKARLVDESLCDGLGACLGHCPQGAISFKEAHAHAGCPSVKILDLRKSNKTQAESSTQKEASFLQNWPIQLKLVPVLAPYLNNADILIAADCVPFSYAPFHGELLAGKILLVGCPKLDDLGAYQEKITGILKNNNIKSIHYAHMEVPCCFGLVGAVKEAIRDSGKAVPFQEIVISIKGERLT